MNRNKIFILFLLFTFTLIGCTSSKDTNTNSEQSDLNSNTSVAELSIKSECLAEAEELSKICQQDMLNDLDIETLNQCSFLIVDRDDFLKKCDDYDSLLLNRLNPFNDSAEDDIFYLKLKKLCHQQKIGNLTLKELMICNKEFEFLELCEYEWETLN